MELQEVAHDILCQIQGFNRNTSCIGYSAFIGGSEMAQYKGDTMEVYL